MKKKILIEGWRYINHSYALVNQFQIKELIKNKNLDIYFFDVPYFNPNWNKSDNHSGFDNYDFLKNLKKPNPNSNFDLIYRLSKSCNFDYVNRYLASYRVHKKKSVCFRAAFFISRYS